jgi:hypothetical protein
MDDPTIHFRAGAGAGLAGGGWQRAGKQGRKIHHEGTKKKGEKETKKEFRGT